MRRPAAPGPDATHSGRSLGAGGGEKEIVQQEGERQAGVRSRLKALKGG